MRLTSSRDDTVNGYTLVHKTFEQLVQRPVQYDIGICVKAEPPLQVSRLLRYVIIDVLDNYYFFEVSVKEKIPPQYVFVSPNLPHGQAVADGGRHHVRVIEEMFTYHNETAYHKETPRFKPVSATVPLRVFSAHRCNAYAEAMCETPCANLTQIPHVRYTCLLEHNNSINRTYSVFLSLVPEIAHAYPRVDSGVRMFHTVCWLRGYFWNTLFRSFDVLVVYAKKEGHKFAFNSIQRTTNALRSGVPTVIERAGIAEKYIDDTYPCGFKTHGELRTLVAALRWNLDLRRECLRVGTEIARRLAHPRVVWGKYEALFRSFLRGELPRNPFFCEECFMT